MLNLPQILFLLAIDDDKGQLVSATSLRYGLKAAVLAELALLERVSLDAGKKLRLLDSTPTGDEILDGELEKICSAGRPKKITIWLNALGQKKLRKQIASSLVKVGVITREEKRFLWVIPNVLFPVRDASAKYWVKQQLRGIVLAGEAPEARRLVLLSLLSACRLLDLIFTKEERKAASKKVDELVREEAFGEAIAQTLEEIEASAAAAARAALVF